MKTVLESSRFLTEIFVCRQKFNFLRSAARVLAKSPLTLDDLTPNGVTGFTILDTLLESQFVSLLTVIVVQVCSTGIRSPVLSSRPSLTNNWWQLYTNWLGVVV